ncbi:hypothetical protein Y1Q_0007577 [Alligator mississippiensis]|uniref:Uncharacterized protein n=1 Tax=Alligator mississippiensis TaxID=8496 RepID=A0A151NHA6_ALLMI|nr:hypothetical protein Y1Q_0007577 [Alligator mississippiensis]
MEDSYDVKQQAISAHSLYLILIQSRFCIAAWTQQKWKDLTRKLVAGGSPLHFLPEPLVSMGEAPHLQKPQALIDTPPLLTKKSKPCMKPEQHLHSVVEASKDVIATSIDTFLNM